MKLKGIWRPYVVVGPAWRTGGAWYLENEALLHISPLGQCRGTGAELSTTLGATRILFGVLTPELSFGFHPYYYILPENQNDYGLRLSLAASVGAEVGL